MDNRAYLKYRQDNPVTNTFLSTYEEVALLPEKLSNQEWVMVTVLLLLAVYAVGAIFIKHRKKKRNDENAPSNGTN